MRAHHRRDSSPRRRRRRSLRAEIAIVSLAFVLSIAAAIGVGVWLKQEAPRVAANMRP